MQKIVPFLWFDDQAEDAVAHYTALFPRSGILDIARYGPAGPGPEATVMTVTFQLAGQEFIALNGGPHFTFSPAISLFVNCESQAELERLWAGLSKGGTVLMELGAYPFSPQFGWVQDRYGLSWQLNLAGRSQKITPFLTFVGDQHGRAEAAIHDYVALFENSSITAIQRYGPDGDGIEGTVQHATFSLAGQAFMASDGGLEHAFAFTPALSFFVNCETQDEVDRLWEGLSAGGEKGVCGWLADRYGVSWQVVPTVLGELLQDEDREKAARVTEAMLQMTKLDIQALQAAYDGR